MTQEKSPEGKNMKFRKKPVVIEAMQFTEETKNQCFNFVTCNRYADWDEFGKSPVLKIQTLEGDITASLGDWIIKGVKGEFYPCKPDIFEQTYEPADREARSQGGGKDEEIRKLREQVYLPNHWRCPKCSFYQVNSILAPDGIFADKRTPEQCPNDGTEMMPVSWKENAKDNYDMGVQQMERAVKAESQLQALSRPDASPAKCEVCGGTDLVCGKGWLEEKTKKDAEIQKLRTDASGLVEALRKAGQLTDSGPYHHYRACCKTDVEKEHDSECFIGEALQRFGSGK